MRYTNKSWLRKLGWMALVGGLLLSGRSAFAQQVRHALRNAALGATDASEPRSEYWIGVALEAVPDAVRAQLDLPENQGVLVSDVVPDSPAEKAGLKRHDVVVAVDEKPITSPKELADTVAAAKDQEIRIRYRRGGKELTAAVMPAKRPEQVMPGGIHLRFLPEGDQRRLEEWFSRLRPGQVGEPLEWRLFHPGVVLPPAGGIGHALPDDMTVTITKQGAQPAKVSVKQGDKSWEATADHLEQLPDEVRQHVEPLLGRFTFRMTAPRGVETYTVPAETYTVPAPSPLGADAEARLNRRLEQLERQVRELHEQLDKLLPKP